MTFNAFLIALDQTLDEAPELPCDPGAPPPRPIPHALYDPCCRDATAPDQVLIGLGHWQQDGRPVEHRGVCLNNKGIADRFGAACRYATVTDLVLNPPEPLRRHWERLTADDAGPGELLRRFTLIAEDTGPDSCFALLCWLARASGVDLEELRTGQGRSWVLAVRQWEGTGMVADPATSWAALLSTLGHSQSPVAAAPAHDSARQPPDVSRGWREALRFTLYLLRHGVHSDTVPRLWGQPDYVRARAFLEVERQEYLQSLGQATCLQLWVPLAGTGGTRRLLVDAYFAVETWPSGARKIFVRTDREHTHLRQGFALMGLYRPGERGTGGDLTVSVNPWTGIGLQLLWVELERLETARWQGRRPCDSPRGIASYPAGAGYNQPWWDDGGRYTLLGAPKALPDWPAGSRLDWPEVLEAAWRCQSPLSGLRVHDLLGQRDCPATECRREALQAPGGTMTKHLAAGRWLPDATCPQGTVFRPDHPAGIGGAHRPPPGPGTTGPGRSPGGVGPGAGTPGRRVHRVARGRGLVVRRLAGRAPALGGTARGDPARRSVAGHPAAGRRLPRRMSAGPAPAGDEALHLAVRRYPGRSGRATQPPGLRPR
ncbi:hypothetical protein [uncultured Thiodictyon sp.]|uniref:hypothetical protein n=1 Tax=uncultured Thiodictyon sp. TaxID=1846217 RepID=UPI0025F2AAA5|nr:hypothetical protein [uncultured Thiodictyon sp.]